MRVLVVDDSVQIRAIVRSILKRSMSVEVIEAGDGLTALQLLLRHPCDLVVLDVMMPLMDGIETLRAIRRSPAHGSLPVVMLTGATDELQVKKALKFGVLDYVAKPFAPDQLQLRLATALGHVTHAPLCDSRALPLALAS